MCTSCWEKIDNFHKFYCEVEQLWDRKDLLKSTVFKTESLQDEDELQPNLLAFTCELVKEESTANDDDPMIEVEVVDMLRYF